MKNIFVRVLPRSSKEEVVGFMANGVLKVKLTTPPVDGKANEKLIDLLSSYYSVHRSAVSIVSGHTSKNKHVSIEE
ncbi:MAG: DUF167 domain-containing protein [Candidatus Magasanikbacteria bacterium]|jgi:uncharacterized protein|nr:DUF167 domain-containing protein [Candidatus Magasanikbacteria bacterium]MBT4220972.1 DUF167 domain-containing protein [Candidatus Magasanikbacteria bacterium]MBT4350490.1 DUF167 domain-containing protein [Candidatus Magasanikbacteria bacterium]MBT4541957.1 DUF167 domain-containing protein [Candidatus Magasanikbacteria bacterium]MBT6252877.1 DUF167 domain-containing protein [Candidatus Magasanikbacteria bacterium]